MADSAVMVLPPQLLLFIIPFFLIIFFKNGIVNLKLSFLSMYNFLFLITSVEVMFGHLKDLLVCKVQTSGWAWPSVQ